MFTNILPHSSIFILRELIIPALKSHRPMDKIEVKIVKPEVS
jgi:hypothetical protein